MAVAELVSEQGQRVTDLRKQAEGKSCVRCGADDETIVLCHYFGPRRDAYGGGMGIKGSDAVAAELCSRCHLHMDTLSRNKDNKWLLSEEFLHYCALTWIRRLEE